MKTLAQKPLHEIRQEEAVATGRVETIERLDSETLTNMLAMTEMFEANIRLSEENTQLMLAITNLYELIIGGGA